MERLDNGQGRPEATLIHLSQAARYSVLALVYLSKRDELSMVKDIATAMRLSPSFLAKVLQRLGHAQLVLGKRGVHGGYRLARAAEKITLADVVAAVDGARDEDQKCMLEMRACTSGQPCVLHTQLHQAELGLWCALRTTRVSDVADDMRRTT